MTFASMPPGRPMDDPFASGSSAPPSLERALFERRIVLLSGAVDVARAGEVAAGLMTLDALGPDPIELRLSATSESLDVAFCLIDAIDTVAAAVNGTVASAVGGTIAGVLAVCGHRRIGVFGRIDLREPEADFQGSATELARQAAALETRVADFVRRVSEAAGRPFEHVEADLRMGRSLDAQGALAYGLVDEIVGRR
jgi:ATP-dependent Clp protease protease subunit